MKIDIVGGGISGLSTAISIKKNNKKIFVNVYEKNKKIGYNYEGKKCGEAHTVEKEWKKWIPEKKSYYNIIKRAIVKTDNKTYKFQNEITKNAYILNRPEFIFQLSKLAEKLGVNIITNKKVKDKNQLDADYIIDASGCPSIFKNLYRLNRGIKGIGYQQTIANSNLFIKDTIKIWYVSEIGYYWIFPRNPEKKEINVGYGLYNIEKIRKEKINIKKKLENFKIENSINGKIQYEIGGMIPIGLQYPLKFKNIIFVGDAGVGCFPFQGQGIYRALLSGDLAGKCIANDKINKYPYYAKKYFIKWDIIGKSFLFLCNTSYKLNKELVNKLWNLMINKIPKTINK
jgi:flavin-dependent dehydrogenase